MDYNNKRLQAEEKLRRTGYYYSNILRILVASSKLFHRYFTQSGSQNLKLQRRGERLPRRELRVI